MASLLLDPYANAFNADPAATRRPTQDVSTRPARGGGARGREDALTGAVWERKCGLGSRCHRTVHPYVSAPLMLGSMLSAVIKVLHHSCTALRGRACPARYELDSLCAVVRLAARYHAATGDRQGSPSPSHAAERAPRHPSVHHRWPLVISSVSH